MLLGDTYSLVIFCLILCKPTPTKFVRDRLHRPTPRLPNHHALELLHGHKAALPTSGGQQPATAGHAVGFKQSELPFHLCPPTYATEDDALAAAGSEWQRI
ncbi:hypothetical protein [Vreelandella neptunia]|uniref:hypothetical protein n=1 Tax=Vreelandella neptunia TaxID=115551 RepID=UPI00315A3443